MSHNIVSGFQSGQDSHTTSVALPEGDLLFLILLFGQPQIDEVQSLLFGNGRYGNGENFFLSIGEQIHSDERAGYDIAHIVEFECNGDVG